MKKWIESKIEKYRGKRPRNTKSKPAFDPDSASDAKLVPANGPDTAEENTPASDAKLISDTQNGPNTAEGSFSASDDAKSASSHLSDERNSQDTQKGDGGSKDLWQIAYEALSDSDRQTLLAVRQLIRTDDHDGHTKTLGIVDEVIRLTKEQYENYQKGGIKIKQGEKDINFRHVAHKILDATLSFKDIVNAIVMFDPTGHAASAWTIVSLGLTMTQNHMKIRAALFESS